jgi:hypothetical protein
VVTRSNPDFFGSFCRIGQVNEKMSTELRSQESSDQTAKSGQIFPGTFSFRDRIEGEGQNS